MPVEKKWLFNYPDFLSINMEEKEIHFEYLVNMSTMQTTCIALLVVSLSSRLYSKSILAVSMQT